jgi:hypothetical protein
MNENDFHNELQKNLKNPILIIIITNNPCASKQGLEFTIVEFLGPGIL